jgi:hypothetical protein
MPDIPRDVTEHSLDIRARARPVKQPLRRFDEEKRRAIGEEIHKLMVAGFIKEVLKGKCAFGPFLSILVIEYQHKCLNVNLCPWMNKVQITSKGMFLSLSTLVLCTNIFV